MKSLILCFTFLHFGHLMYAQKDLIPCNCDVLNSPQKNYFATEKQASDLLNQYVDALWSYSKIKKITDPFYIKEANCASPTSMVCETVLTNGRHQNIRLILYNNLFLNSLTSKERQITLVDKHILLHELGHHVLGHHKKTSASLVLRDLYDQQTVDPKLWNKYGIDNPMAQELEADIYAVWALSNLEPNFSVDKLIEQLNGEMLKNLDDLSRKEKHSDHPLFKDRIETMKKFEAELKRKHQHGITKSYFSDIASSAYLALWPESYVYDLSISAGSSLGSKTDFSADGQKAGAFLYPISEFENYHIGLTASRFLWDKPIQTELDIQYSRHKYGTTAPSADGDLLVEKFEVHYLSFCPRLTWSSISASRRSELRSLRIGVFSSIGINLNVPLGGINYSNFIATTAGPSLLFSAAPKLMIGASVLKKSFLPRGFKLSVSYEPQWIRLKTSPKPHAVAHNIECTLHYTILRK